MCVGSVEMEGRMGWVRQNEVEGWGGERDE